MEEYLQNIFLLKILEGVNLDSNIVIEGQRNIEDLIKNRKTSCFYFWSFS